MSRCVIRTATASDLPVLSDVFRRSSLSNDGDREMLLAHPEVLEFDGAGLEDGRTRVATIDGRVVGFTTVADEGGVVDLEDLFVDPDRMRNGVGLELMHDVFERARERGATRVEVTANSHAMAFYTRAGFVKCGEVDTRFAPADRLRVDL